MSQRVDTRVAGAESPPGLPPPEKCQGGESINSHTQAAILPLVSYFDTLRWLFIAVALMGIAVTIYARVDD